MDQYHIYVTHELEDPVELCCGFRCEHQACFFLDHETHPGEHKGLMRSVPGQARARQGRAGQGKARQGRAGQGRAGQDRAGQGRGGHGGACQGVRACGDGDTRSRFYGRNLLISRLFYYVNTSNNISDKTYHNVHTEQR